MRPDGALRVGAWEDAALGRRFICRIQSIVDRRSAGRQAGRAAIASEARQKVSSNPALFRQVLSSTRAHSFHLTPRW